MFVSNASTMTSTNDWTNDVGLQIFPKMQDMSTQIDKSLPADTENIQKDHTYPVYFSTPKKGILKSTATEIAPTVLQSPSTENPFLSPK